MIKTATLADIDALVKLFDAYRVWYRKTSAVVAATQFLTERIEKREAVIFLAQEGDKIIGFTQLYPLFSSVRMRRMWLLNDLFVDPAYRGQGFSKELIEAAKDLCKKTDACGVLLETETSNLIGNSLYPAVGFQLEENNFYFWTNNT